MAAKPNASFFLGLRNVLGFLGGGWFPTSTRDGIAPFRRVSSDAGPEVTSGAALQLAAAYACVKLISETVGTLPLSLYHQDASGKMQIATGSLTHRMIHDTPNTEMTAVNFWEMVVASMCLWGNAYVLLTRVAGKVASMTPLRPEFMTVFRGINGFIQYGYNYGTTQQVFSSDEIMHVRGFGIDGLIGLSPVAMARQTIGRSIATDQASGSIFKSGLAVSGFIKYAKSFVNKEQRDGVRDQISAFSGSANTGQVMVLENGMDYQPMSMMPNDAQLLESRQFNVEEVCRWYGVPPQLIGHLTKSSSWASSLENTTLGFLKFALRPYLVRIEQALRKSLAIPSSSKLKFNLEALLRGDSAARAALWASASQNGWMARDEIREEEDLVPMGGNAKVLTVQSNMIKLNDLGKTPPAPVSPEPNPAVDPTP